MSLFRGRGDVYAKWWERRDGKAQGYVPAYADWKKKTYAPLTNAVIEQHLMGNIIVGLYPLLKDNTSYLITADFDGKKWLTAAKRLIKICEKHNLPVYTERSRSGNGGHIWCFFEGAYPAHKSRKIFLQLLRQSKNISEFDKDDSFDRLFPNQDYHAGKGFGNLIALPLQGAARKEGNSLFLDPENKYKVADDQWQFLDGVERVPINFLDKLFDTFTETAEKIVKKQKKSDESELSLTLAEYIRIPKESITLPLAKFLREHLNFKNSEYFIKSKLGVPIHTIERYFKTILENDTEALVPRGFLNRLISYLKEEGISYDINDQRTKLKPVRFKPTYTLFDFQKEALQYFDDVEAGVLVAPPGSGKTIMGLELTARKKQPALILTHRRQIYAQWVESVESFLGILKKNIGQYGSTKKEIKSSITVAMVQTLSKVEDWSKFTSAFGLVLVDECHHMPARTFRDIVTKFNPYYLYGLTATPKRKYNDESLIYAYLGDVVYEISRSQISGSQKKTASCDIEMVVRETLFSLPFSITFRDFQFLAKMTIFDSRRNAQIAEDVAKEARAGNRCLILTERKEHVETLKQYLKRDFEVITLTGDMSQQKRQFHEKHIKEGNFQILIATGQLLGEGSDIQNLDCLFLVFPFSFEGKLVQYIGRIERGKGEIKKVYDYRDRNMPILEKLYQKRKKYYDKIKKEKNIADGGFFE